MRRRSRFFLPALLAGALVPATALAVNATHHRFELGQRFTEDCPPNFAWGSVWGSDVYTDDSDICTAAVHAGVITQASGGTVTYEMRAGGVDYVSTERNGVTTSAYHSWPGSYIVVGAAPGTGGGGVAGGVATACGLGEYWDVVDTDGAWLGTWVPTSDSTLDGYWTRPGEPDFLAPLALSIDATGRVVLHRDDPEPNKYTTTDCTYEGQLQPDGVTVTGTVTCNSGVGRLGPHYWYATIVCG